MYKTQCFIVFFTSIDIKALNSRGCHSGTFEHFFLGVCFHSDPHFSFNTILDIPDFANNSHRKNCSRMPEWHPPDFDPFMCIHS